MKKVDSKGLEQARKFAPAETPEGREKQLVAMAFDLAEQQMRDGTIAAQTLNYFLKLGSKKEMLEQQMLEEQNKLIKAKAEAVESQKEVTELYSEAIKAFREYNGQTDDGEDLYD